MSYRIGFDLDGCVADFLATWTRYLHDIAGTPCHTYPEMTTTDLAAHYGVSKRQVNQAWRAFYQTENVWEKIPSLITNDEWWRLRCLADTWDIAWITARRDSKGRSAQEQSTRWLQWHLLREPVVFVAEHMPLKSLICDRLDIRIMVDDHPRAIKALADAGVTVIAPAYPYNLVSEVQENGCVYSLADHYPHVWRAPSFGAILDLLEECDGKAHTRNALGLA